MENKIELTAGQSAGLELLIKTHQDNPDFITDIIDCVVHATPAVQVTLQVTEMLAGESRMSSENLAGDLKAAKNSSLEKLLELRNNSIVKK